MGNPRSYEILNGELTTIAKRTVHQHKCHPEPSHNALYALISPEESVAWSVASSNHKSFDGNEYGINGRHTGTMTD